MSYNHDLIKNNPLWKQARIDCLERDGFACVRCGSDERLEVDHIIPLELNIDLAFELSNLQTLCAPCHYEKGREDDARSPRLAWVHPEYAELIGDLVFSERTLEALERSQIYPDQSE